MIRYMNMIKQNQNSQVGLSSAGNYSCSTHQSNTATVTIIVVQGEQRFGKHKRKRHIFCCMFCTNCVQYICKPDQILLESWAVVSFPSNFLYNNFLTFCPHVYHKVALPPPFWSFSKTSGYFKIY